MAPMTIWWVILQKLGTPLIQKGSHHITKPH